MWIAQRVVEVSGAITSMSPLLFGLGWELLTIISFSDCLVVYKQLVGRFYSLSTRHVFML